MGYLFLIACIIVVVVVIARDKKKKAAPQGSDTNSSGNTPHRISFNFEKLESLFFWTFVPLLFGVVFYTCVFSPMRSCTNRLDAASNKATAEMQYRDRQSRLMYLEYQRRAYPNRHPEPSRSQSPLHSHHQNTGSDKVFQDLSLDYFDEAP